MGPSKKCLSYSEVLRPSSNLTGVLIRGDQETDRRQRKDHVRTQKTAVYKPRREASELN